MFFGTTQWGWGPGRLPAARIPNPIKRSLFNNASPSTGYRTSPPDWPTGLEKHTELPARPFGGQLTSPATVTSE